MINFFSIKLSKRSAQKDANEEDDKSNFNSISINLKVIQSRSV